LPLFRVCVDIFKGKSFLKYFHRFEVTDLKDFLILLAKKVQIENTTIPTEYIIRKLEIFTVKKFQYHDEISRYPSINPKIITNYMMTMFPS